MHFKGLMKAAKKNIQTDVIANNGRGLQQDGPLAIARLEPGDREKSDLRRARQLPQREITDFVEWQWLLTGISSRVGKDCDRVPEKKTADRRTL